METNPKKHSILIVEDEPYARDILKKTILRRWDVAVFTTPNALEAIEITRKINPTIIFTDITIEGGMSGWKMIDEIRTFNDQAKIVVVTGNLKIEKEETESIKHHALFAVIHKPVVIDELLRIVTEILDEEGVYLKMVVSTNADVSVKGSPESRAIIHALNNRLSIIKMKCMGYIKDIEDGYTAGKTDAEMIQEAVFVLKLIEKEIDSARLTVEDIRHLK